MILMTCVTLGGRKLPAFSHPIESTGASSEDLIFLIPSSTSSQFGGGPPALDGDVGGQKASEIKSPAHTKGFQHIN